MIVVRETFVAKPGMASKLARLMVEALGGGPGRFRVLTDMVGVFNTVVLETELESLAAFEQRVQEYRTNEQLRSRIAGYTDLYSEGRREIYQVVE